MYAYCNTEVCLRKNCCSGDAISTKYYEHVSVFLP
jgi:hypothetical protein